jgi:heme-degrading monooxygenase HmoA
MPRREAIELRGWKPVWLDDEVLLPWLLTGETEYAMFIALSQFTVANDMTEQVKDAFASRPHLVEEAPGFLRLEVISPLDNKDEIWLLTYWSDEESFKAWHHSHLYHDSHRGIPKGLKLVPRSARLRFFEHVSS